MSATNLSYHIGTLWEILIAFPFLINSKSTKLYCIIIKCCQITSRLFCKLCRDWYKVDLPAPLTPAISIYFYAKRASFLLPDVVFFAEESHQPSHKNFFALLFPPLIQVVRYLLVVSFLSLHRFFHISLRHTHNHLMPKASAAILTGMFARWNFCDFLSN